MISFVMSSPRATPCDNTLLRLGWMVVRGAARQTSGVDGKKILRTYYFFISLANVGGPIACWFLNRKLYLQTLHN